MFAQRRNLKLYSAKIMWHFFIMGCFIFFAPLSFANDTHNPTEIKYDRYYPSLMEMQSFPYIAEFVLKNHSQSRENAQAIWQEEQKQIKQEGEENIEPLIAERAENDLSHLLSLMLYPQKRAVRAMVVYDANGELMGISSEEAANQRLQANQQKLNFKNLMAFFPSFLSDSMYHALQKKLGTPNAQPQGFRFILPHPLKGQNEQYTLAVEGLYHPENHHLVGYVFYLFD